MNALRRARVLRQGRTCLGATGLRLSHWKPVRARVAAIAMTRTSARDCELPASTMGATPDTARFTRRKRKPDVPATIGSARSWSWNCATQSYCASPEPCTRRAVQLRVHLRRRRGLVATPHSPAVLEDSPCSWRGRGRAAGGARLCWALAATLGDRDTRGTGAGRASRGCGQRAAAPAPIAAGEGKRSMSSGCYRASCRWSGSD